METWLNFQIDYLERCFKRKFTKKEVMAIKWYLSLSNEDQKVFLVILKKYKNGTE